MSPSVVKRVLLGTNVIWVLAGVASALPAMFAVMMLDAPGSESRWATLALVGALMSFPLVCVVAVVESRASRRGENFARAWRWACLPLVNLVVGGFAAAWISVAQGGMFAG